jgi:hypothetical protein
VTVSFDLSYSGLTNSEALVAGVFDAVSNTLANGMPSSTPDPCFSLSDPQYAGKTICVWALNSTSGTEHVSFQVQFPGTHIQAYDFSAAGAILTSQGNLAVSTEQSFSITAGTTVELTVTTSYPVAVTVDGSTTASNPIELAPGVHTISVPAIVPLDNVSRLRFDHWEDGSSQPNRSVYVVTDTGIEATYVRQYMLTLVSPSVNASGAGWYDDGSYAHFSVPSSQPIPGLIGLIGGKLVFAGWYENGNQITTANTGAISMVDAHALTAQWTEDYTIPLAIFGAVALAIAASVALFVTRLDRKKTRKKKRRRR